MTKMVSVDLDRSSTVLLLRAYLSAKRMLPDVPIEVFVSPTGVGFHIKIYKQVSIEQDLKIRAQLWDHADRIVYALKKWALNPQEEYIDLVFDEKNNGKENRIDLEAILQPYSEDVQQINEFVQNGEAQKAEPILLKLAKTIEPELDKHKRKQYVGCVAFKTDELHDQLEEICKKIMEKDKTFSWKLYPCWFPEFDWILAIFTDDKDKAWEKIVWLKNNAYIEKERERIKILKDADTRLFVKERMAT